MPDQEPEEGFTIRDRRRSAAPPAEAAPPPAAAEPTPPVPVADDKPDAAVTPYGEGMEGTGEMDGMGEGDPNALPDVYSILALFMGELRNIAWLRMGLVANPATGEMETDMEQAKVAINTVGFLASQLEPVIAPEEKLPLRALVSDLQINFSQQAAKQNGG